MPFLITELTLTISAIKKTTRKKNKISKNKNYTEKLNVLRAPSKNVKIQSDKILSNQINFTELHTRLDFSLMRQGNTSTKKRTNEENL